MNLDKSSCPATVNKSRVLIHVIIWTNPVAAPTGPPTRTVLAGVRDVSTSMVKISSCRSSKFSTNLIDLKTCFCLKMFSRYSALSSPTPDFYDIIPRSEAEWGGSVWVQKTGRDVPHERKSTIELAGCLLARTSTDRPNSMEIVFYYWGDNLGDPPLPALRSRPPRSP